jgi:hypothetical protein
MVSFSKKKLEETTIRIAGETPQERPLEEGHMVWRSSRDHFCPLPCSTAIDY